MPLYLGRFRYSAEARKAMVRNPQDRSAAAREAIESLGGTMMGFWFAFGEHDGVFLAEVPDNATAAGLAMAIGATGTADIETSVPARHGRGSGGNAEGRHRDVPAGGLVSTVRL
jgi:uncharacterized protein with GYD domain